jgi:methyl-accepting chemotaxis protein
MNLGKKFTKSTKEIKKTGKNKLQIKPDINIKGMFTKHKVREMLKNLTHIRAKLILAFLVPVVLIIVLGTLSYSKSSKGLIGSYESSTMSNMSNMTKYLEFGFDIVSSKAALLNSDKVLQSYYSGAYKKNNMEEISRFREVQDGITTNILSEDYIANIYLLANYGTGISGNGTLSSKLVYDDFVAGGEGAFFAGSEITELWIGTHPYLDTQSVTSSDKYAISYMRYLYSGSKKPIGCIVLDVSYDYVNDLLLESGLPEGSVIAFVSNDGREIINGTTPESYKFTEQDYYLSALKDTQNNEGSEYVEFNNNDYLFVYSKINTSGSMLCAVIPKGVIVKQADEVKSITLLVVILASIIAIALGTFIASGFSNTIHKINKVLQKTEAGDLTIVTSVKRKDEFQILGKSINDMIGSMMRLIKKMAGISNTVSQSAIVVSESSSNLVSATQNISDAVGDIEQGVTQQAVDSENCLHQMADLAARINSLYSNTHNIEQIAGSTKGIVNGGIGIVDNLSSKVKDTTEITRNVILAIENLEKETTSIVGIVGTINEIAAQTNLLSLNASIEAARAGQYGRGFSVVADEIRKLADQSLKSSNEIGKIINKIEEQTKKTVNTAKLAQNIVLSQEDALNSTVNVFTDINKHFEELTDNLNQIAYGVEGIEHAKDDTLGSIESISATAQQTAAAAEQLGVTAEKQLEEVNKLNNVVQQLSSDAVNLEETVRVFKVD